MEKLVAAVYSKKFKKQRVLCKPKTSKSDSTLTDGPSIVIRDGQIRKVGQIDDDIKELCRKV